MKKIYIKTEKHEISDESIVKNKDFDKVYQSFLSSPKPFFKSGKFWFGLNSIVVLIVATVLFIIFNKNNNSIKDAESPVMLTDSSFINPPISGENIEYEVFEINPEKKNILSSKSGSKIIIPANSFSIRSNKKVTIKYREFHTTLDFFKSGIPMDYDSAGRSFTFESAGMFELLAYQDEKPVSLVKTLEVDLISYNSEDRFNSYYLDTNKRNWIYEGRDQIIKKENISENEHIVIKNETVKLDTCENQNHVISSQNLVKPQQANRQNFIFEANVELSNFPELNQYKGILYEISNKYTNFDKKYYEIRWERAWLARSEYTGFYNLNLQRKDSIVKLIVYPVFEGKNYLEAMKIYNESKERYEKSVKSNTQQKAFQKPKTVSTSDMVDFTLAQKGISAYVFRKVMVPRTGIYNCDQPLIMVQYRAELAEMDGSVFTPFYKNADGTALNIQKICLVQLNKNALFTLKMNDKIKCEVKNNYVLWILTADGQIGIITPKDFRQKIESSMQPEFTFDLLSASEGLNKLESVLKS